MTPDEIKLTVKEILDDHNRGFEQFRRASEELVRATNQVRKSRGLLDDAEQELAVIQQRQSDGLQQVMEANRAALRLLRDGQEHP